MKLPNTYTDKDETGCCAIPNIDAWDNKEVNFDNKTFVRMYTKSFLFVPLNMNKVMTALQSAVAEHNALPRPEDAMILSRDLSPWKAEQLYYVSAPIEGLDNVTLNGTFLSKVFEGPYKDAKKWYETMQHMAVEKGKAVKEIYMFYTTCPKCAKHYGKNYTIGFARVE